jgi:hypothetical protein
VDVSASNYICIVLAMWRVIAIAIGLEDRVFKSRQDASYTYIQVKQNTKRR